jgi:betaine-aldehyde dehydrogenase
MTSDGTTISEFATDLFIGGTWRPSTGGTFVDLNPATGEPLVNVAAGTAHDLRRRR